MLNVVQQRIAVMELISLNLIIVSFKNKEFLGIKEFLRMLKPRIKEPNMMLCVGTFEFNVFSYVCM